jgi:hypothetical protein
MRFTNEFENLEQRNQFYMYWVHFVEDMKKMRSLIFLIQHFRCEFE